MKKYIGFIIILTLAHTCVYSQIAEYTSNELLVKMKPHKTSIQKANLKSQMNAHAIKTLPQTDVEVWQLGASQDVPQVIAQYRYHPDIEFVEPNYIYSIHTNNPNDPDYDKLWGLHNTGQNGGTSDVDVDAPEAWNITTGSPSVAVAIIDTGIDWKHEDLAENIWQNLAEDADGDGRVLEWLNGEWAFDPGDENGIDDDGNGYVDDFIGWDFANNDNDPSDGNSHGTHVAGIVGAKGNNGVGITGIAPNVQLAALKYLDDEGFGYADDAVAALNYAVDMGIPISNNSWGGGGYSTPFYQALRNAEMNGHIFVSAAGNSGDNNDAFPTFPASYDVENVISVANIDRNDALNPTSNFGINSVHIAAPGTEIWSCLPLNGYGYKSGTSMAAPLVAGACALLWSEHPDRSYAEVREAVFDASTQTDVLANKCLTGGRLNVYDAFESIIPPIPLAPCYLEDSATVRKVYGVLMGEHIFEVIFDGRPFNTWEGITLSAEGCVIDINTAFLPAGYISPPPYNEFVSAWAGFIHPDIVNLSELESLALVHRDGYSAREVFDGVVPGFLGELPKLEYLKVKTWYNTPVISPPTTDWNIRYLDLSDSRVTDSTFPTEFGNLPNLNTLYLNDNQLTQIPDFIYDLDSLQLLFLDNNEISGCYDEAIFSLCSSVYVSINGNDMDATWEEFCQAGGTSACNGYSACRTADSLNLVEIYHALDGSSWTNSWNLNQPIHTWHGIGLTTAGCVDSLNLSNNQLNGDIPSEIANLIKLKHLYLDNNQLTGKIPAWLSNLDKLEYLTLSHNQLYGCYPYVLLSLRSLENDSDATISDGNDFYTSWSELINPIGIKWGICAGFSPCRETDSLALVELYHANDGSNWLNTWNFQEPLDTWYGVRLLQQGCVGYLDLSNNQLSGNIQPEIGLLRDMKFLYLNDNQLTGSIPKELRGMFRLDTLRLYNNQLSGCFPIELRYFCSSLYMDDVDIDTGNNFDVEWDVFCQNELGVCTGYEGCRENDSLNLVTIYNQTNGENWLNTWDFIQSLDEWYGVSLDENGCLVRLELNDNGLSGNIPVELENLSELTYLALNGNQLTGNIPVEITALNQLNYIDLSDNNLSGCYDVELVGLCNITNNISEGNNFDTSWASFCNYQYGLCGGLVGCRERDSLALVEIYNQTDGENWTYTWDLQQPIDTWQGVSTGVGGCVKELNLLNKQLTGQIPPAIENLEELEVLNLEYNNLSGNIPTEIGNLSELKELYLNRNQLTATIPESIYSLSRLVKLNLGENQLSGSISDSIENLDRLEELYLYNNQLNGNIPQSVGNLDELVHLSLSNNQLSGSIPESVGNLDQLVYLYLSNNQLTSIPSSIANIIGLARFYIANNAMTGCFPNELRSGYLNVVEYYDLAILLEYEYVEVIWSIDYGNNFDASWDNFIESGGGTCGTVWPGDFNADGKVDKSDVLYWGLAEGNTGISRDDASSSWYQQGSSNWQQSVNGINSKHQDGNGDGTVDAQDLDVLVANYRKTHTFNPQNYIASGIEYRLEPLSDTTNGGNVILRYALYAEESGAPASVHGITCSIDFGELAAGNITIDTTGSSLQPQQQVGIFNAVENRLDLALTRTDKQNTLCDGPVVVVEAIVAMKDLPSDGTFSLHVNNNGSMMEANGTVNAASGMTVYDAFSFSDTEMLLTATATHAECGTLGEAKINITGGVAPYNIWWNTGETTHQITDLTPEKYTATVTDAIGDEKTIEVEIQGRYIPSYDEAGNVLDCNIIAARIQPELCVLLEGAYSDSTGLMSSSLLSLDVLPDRQPYDESPWNYSGTEGLNWQTADYPAGMIDWLLVSFRTQPSADTQVGEVAAILLEDGCLHFTDNYVSLTQNVDSLYVVIEHRNHAAVMTPHPITLTGDVLTYDFRTNDSYRTPTSSGQKQLIDGNYAMYAGDCDQSDANGYDINGQDKTPWEPLNGTFGTYDIPDLNLDGDVNGADKALWFMNNGISSIVPK